MKIVVTPTSFNFISFHFKRKNGSTTQKWRRKAAPPKGGGGQAARPERSEERKAAPPRRREVSSTTDKKIGKEHGKQHFTTKCRQMHLPHATFSHAQSLHRTDDMCVRLKTSSLSCAPTTLTSSTNRGSFAARDTEHFLTVSFFYSSCVVSVHLSDSRLVVHASINPLRRSTAGWHFCGLPTSHRV